MTMGALSVTITRQGRVATLAVSGELDIATTPTLTRQAADALRLPTERLIIDLSGLVFLDCGGARALAAVTRAAPSGCPVLVRGVGRRARCILDLLAVQLERPGSVAVDRAEWLILEAQVLRSWSQETRTRSRQTRARSSALTAQARQAHGRRAAIPRSVQLAGPQAPRIGTDGRGLPARVSRMRSGSCLHADTRVIRSRVPEDALSGASHAWAAPGGSSGAALSSPGLACYTVLVP